MFVTGRAQITADNDLNATRMWLTRFVDTRSIFENYRKEAERLLLWSVVVIGKPLPCEPLTRAALQSEDQPLATSAADSCRCVEGFGCFWRAVARSRASLIDRPTRGSAYSYST